MEADPKMPKFLLENKISKLKLVPTNNILYNIDLKKVELLSQALDFNAVARQCLFIGIYYTS